MQIQCDHKERVIALTNLIAMCEDISSVCHRYHVSNITGRYIYVEYSNPNEYGIESPMVAVFPRLPDFPTWGNGSEKTPMLLLDIHDVKHDNWDGEGWQAFIPLLDHVPMYRDPNDGTWKTEKQIEEEKNQADNSEGRT